MSGLVRARDPRRREGIDPERAGAFASAASEAGVLVGRGAPGVLVLAPPLDIETQALETAGKTLLETAVG